MVQRPLLIGQAGGVFDGSGDGLRRRRRVGSREGGRAVCRCLEGGECLACGRRSQHDGAELRYEILDSAAGCRASDSVATHTEVAECLIPKIYNPALSSFA